MSVFCNMDNASNNLETPVCSINVTTIKLINPNPTSNSIKIKSGKLHSKPHHLEVDLDRSEHKKRKKTRTSNRDREGARNRGRSNC